jgi:Mrp family chromosome partitioning ATPase
LTLGGLLSVLLELRDKTFRTSTQVEQQIGSLRVGATPRASRRARKSPADVVLTDQLSVMAEAFRVSWANIQLAMQASKRTSAFAEGRCGMALGITSAATGEGKSTHALAFARTAALAGEKVVLVDADLRRSGVSRLLDRDYSFTLLDFLRGQCTADAVIAAEERSGIHFVPSTPVQATWTRQGIQRFYNLVDYLKQRFAVVIIDLPPVLGLAETLHLSIPADNIVLVIRWARTERQIVQFALDALHNAGAVVNAAILNDIDLRAQQRCGYRDRSVVYTDADLYRTAPGARHPAPQASMLAMTTELEANLVPAPAADNQRNRSEFRGNATKTTTAGGSDIERLYDRSRLSEKPAHEPAP